MEVVRWRDIYKAATEDGENGEKCRKKEQEIPKRNLIRNSELGTCFRGDPIFGQTH
jgi:hypothetical protein